MVYRATSPSIDILGVGGGKRRGGSSIEAVDVEVTPETTEMSRLHGASAATVTLQSVRKGPALGAPIGPSLPCGANEYGSLAAGKPGFQGELARVQQLDLRGPCLELHERSHLHDTETIEHAQPSAADTEQLDPSGEKHTIQLPRRDAKPGNNGRRLKWHPIRRRSRSTPNPPPSTAPAHTYCARCSRACPCQQRAVMRRSRSTA